MFTKERVKQLNSERLVGCKAALVEKVLRLVQIAETRGYTLLVTSGKRTVAQQNALYAQGRTKPGKIVTDAKGNQSNHVQGEAADLAFIVDGEVTWKDDLYNLIGRWADAVGLKWGGNWKKNKDRPHVEI